MPLKLTRAKMDH